MISIEGVRKEFIRIHCQLGIWFYCLLWGPHIHHGLWDGDESVYPAQCDFTDRFADLAAFKASDNVMDIGGGMGGSSIQLAKLRGCDVTGVTLSLVECTEHFFDKCECFQRAFNWLRPGGRMTICAWFERDHATTSDRRRQCEELCERFVCPSLATRTDYAGWMMDQGMRIVDDEDWTDRVLRTLVILKQHVKQTDIRHLAKILDHEQVDFIDGFDALLNWYRSGAMQ